MFNDISRDVRFAARMITRSQALTCVIVISLALGIGVNTAIFSLIRAVMLSSLPVQEPQRLVLFHWYGDQWPKGMSQSGSGGPSNAVYKFGTRSLAYPFFRQLQSETSLFEAVFAFVPLGGDRLNTTLVAEGSAERVDGEMVSGDYFRGLRVSATLGRLISIADERTAARVAVLSYPYWMRRFAGEPATVRRVVTINHEPFTIIGIASRGFFGVRPGRSPDVWVPMLEDPHLPPWGFRPADVPSLQSARRYWWTHVMARLRSGVDERQARARGDALFQPFVADALPELDRANPPHIGTENGSAGLDTLRATYGQPLLVLMAMAGLVLLIACANVAVLLLARAMGRRAEFAVRLSLGAARGRLVRQLLAESVLLGSLGGALGMATATSTTHALLLLVPSDRRPLIDTHVDAATLAFAALVSLATAVLFGLAPAVLATRIELLPAMKQSGTGPVASESPAQKIWSATFVVVQMALSLVLLIGAMLFVGTITNLQRQSLGVDDRHLLVFGLDASQSGYTGERLANVYAEIVKRLAEMPGVEAASAARLRLFSGWVSNGSITIRGVAPKPSMDLNTNAVAPDFARTTGMRVLAGRDLTWSDLESKRRVAVVNEEMARYFFGIVNVVGRRYSHGTIYDPADEYEIVGVVSNAKYNQVRDGFPPTAYIPFSAMRGALRGLYFHVRTQGDPRRIASVARAVVRDVDPSCR